MSFLKGWQKKEEPKPMATRYQQIKENAANLSNENLAGKSAGASHLLTDPAFCKAYTELVGALQDAICSTKPEDTISRESMYMQVRSMSLMVNKLNSFIEEQKIATEQQQEKANAN